MVIGDFYHILWIKKDPQPPALGAGCEPSFRPSGPRSMFAGFLAARVAKDRTRRASRIKGSIIPTVPVRLVYNVE